MLAELYINNIAVIQEATITFQPGLNVFTGETGAGKTILVHAINAVLGERASRDMIRTGEQKATITALFTQLSQAILDSLEELGYPAEDDSLLIYRELSVDGRGACKINGRPATVAILKMISGLLINVHGQHDNQQLLSVHKHLGFIDSFGEHMQLLENYKKAYQQYQNVKEELESFNTDEAQKAHRIDLLNYQIAEIEAAQLIPGEEEDLKAQRNLIKNSLEVTTALGAGLSILEGDGEYPGLNGMVSALEEQMLQVAKYLEAFSDISQRISDLVYEFEGFTGDIQDQLDGFAYDPSQLDVIEQRLDLIYSLRKKYGSDVTAILEYLENAQAELESIQMSGQREEQLRILLDEHLAAAVALAEKLTDSRRKAAKRFVKAVGEELVFLDMPNVKLSFEMLDKPLSADGKDHFELFLSPNIGEQAKSLSKTASGGELSRIMLSIKNVMANRDGIATLIFDEVDTGVSGRAADKIGQKLRQVSSGRQVIVVTHLAQVACYANHHLYIYKQARENRTYTKIAPLNPGQRVKEIARISGGEVISDAAIEHAKEMLRNAGNLP